MGGGSSNQPGYSRPKSAGAVRRAPSASSAGVEVPRTINLANVYGAQQQQQYQMYTQQQLQQAQLLQQQQQQQQQQPITVTPHLNHYNGGGGAAPAPSARPLSANATSQTSREVKAYQLPADHWSTTYKAHYGYSAASTAAAAAGGATAAASTSGAAAAAASGGAGTAATAPQNVSYGTTGTAGGAGGGSGSDGAGRPSSAVQSKLRHAVQLDGAVNINAVNAAAAAAAAANGNASGGGAAAAAAVNTTHSNVYSSKNATNIDNELDDDGEGMGLETNAVSGTGLSHHHVHTHQQQQGASSRLRNQAGGAAAAGAGEEEEEEMDGKPVDQSRSHPEVSLTTPSASLELAHGSSHHGGSGVDVRNSSLDSFSEDHIVVGLSTVPNQFCTKRDAFELRKLLALSSGTRGGIVPSSSAVMDMYMVGKVVGVGSYGKVRAAWHRLTSSKVAIKTYDKSKLKDPAHWKRVHSEIKIMEQISHPRIARMYEAVETPKRMHLIMECLDGGNLCSYVKAKRRLSEDESKRIFFQIAQAMEHLHALGVSHRDVKLENVLFANDRDIKLIDFGFSTVCQPGKPLKVFCGTPSCKLLMHIIGCTLFILVVILVF
jgi:hypothetical protein